MRTMMLLLVWYLSAMSSFAVEGNKFIKVQTDLFRGYIISKEYATQNLQGILLKQGDVFSTPASSQVVMADLAFKRLLWESKESRITAYQNFHGRDYIRDRLIQNFEGVLPYIQKNYNVYSRRFVGIVADGKK